MLCFFLFPPCLICRDEISDCHQRQEGKTPADQSVWMVFLGCCVFHRCCHSARVTRCGAATCWPAGAFTLTDCRRYPAAVGSRASSRSEEIIWCWSQRNTIWSKGTFTLWVWTAATLSDTAEMLWESCSRFSYYLNLIIHVGYRMWRSFVEKSLKKKRKKVKLLLIPVKNFAKKSPESGKQPFNSLSWVCFIIFE